MGNHITAAADVLDNLGIPVETEFGDLPPYALDAMASAALDCEDNEFDFCEYDLDDLPGALAKLLHARGNDQETDKATDALIGIALSPVTDYCEWIYPRIVERRRSYV